jgi:hypothetical protein
MTQTKQAKHTAPLPLPLLVSQYNSQCITDAESETVCMVEGGSGNAKERAQYIVRAVNSHEELLYALQRVYRESPLNNELNELVRKAIAKAGGEA